MLRKIKKVGVKKMIKYAAFMAVSIVSLSIQEFAVAGLNAYKNFTQPKALNFGFLSSTYVRDIKYETGEDGVVLSESSDYQFTDDDGITYYYYSITRPTDYHTNKYIGMEFLTDNTIFEGAEIEIKEIPALESNPNESYVPLGKGLEVYNVTIKNEDGTTSNEPVGVLGGETYLLENKYEYRNGYYYINTNAGEIERTPVTLNFVPETYDDNGPKEYETPNYVTNNGKYYVHGEFVGGVYQYDNNYFGNLLKYDGNGYTINGVEIEASIAENNEIKMTYAPENAFEFGYEGYDYFNSVYYAAGGTQKLKVAEDGPELVKYATFKFVKKVDSLSYEDADLGTKGVDYIVQEYIHDDYVLNNNGDWLKLDSGEYLEIKEINRYNESGKQDANGTYLKDADGNYHDIIPGTNTYVQHPKYYGLFVIDSDKTISDTGTATDFVNEKYIFDINYEVTIPVYPYSFVNPYKTAQEGAKDETYRWTYCKEVEKEGVEFAPTYYVYEGGYTAYIDELNNGSIVYTAVDDSEFKVAVTQTEYNDNKDEYSNFYDQDGENYYRYTGLTVQKYTINGDGEIETTGNMLSITLYDMVENWDTYNSGWYVPAEECPLDELYNVYEGKLYAANPMYSLDENGLLSRLSLKTISNLDKSTYEGMYLSNKTVKFYTRYRYMQSGSAVDFTGELWGKYYNLIPTSGTSINKGRVTKFEESVRVILGGCDNVAITNTKTVSSGTIKVN